MRFIRVRSYSNRPGFSILRHTRALPDGIGPVAVYLHPSIQHFFRVCAVRVGLLRLEEEMDPTLAEFASDYELGPTTEFLGAHRVGLTPAKELALRGIEGVVLVIENVDVASHSFDGTLEVGAAASVFGEAM